MWMRLDEIMKIRHQTYHDNGGIFFKGSKFFKTRDKLGVNWFGIPLGKDLPVSEWEEIKVIGENG